MGMAAFQAAKTKISGFLAKHLTALVLLLLAACIGIIFMNYIISTRRTLQTLTERVEALNTNENNILSELKYVKANNEKLVKDNETLVKENQRIVKDNEKILSDFKNLDNFKLGTLKNTLRLEAYDRVVFNAAETGRGVSRIDSSDGIFFIALDKAEKYLDGYKLNFKIGNPQNCAYSGYSINCTWGKKLGSSSDYEKRKSGIKSKEISLAETLYPGRWNTFNIVISPAAAEEVQYVEIKLDTKQLSLSPAK